MEPIVQACHLNKHFGKSQVLTDINLTINTGEIVGVIGTNGAGKTTLLKSLLGLTRVNGQLNVCGYDPRQAQDKLMEKVSFIADTAILPKWITATQIFDYTEQVHPNFNRKVAEAFLQKTKITSDQTVKKMSKGMVTQLHLALVTAIESDLLVLDEPTLGLDIIHRKAFYQHLLESYFDDSNTIIITTHQVEEIEHILTRVVFIDDGKILLDINVEDIPNRFVQLHTNEQDINKLSGYQVMYQHKTLTGIHAFYDGVDAQALKPFGMVKTPNLSDIFIALVEQKNAQNSLEVSHV